MYKTIPIQSIQQNHHWNVHLVIKFTLMIISSLWFFDQNPEYISHSWPLLWSSGQSSWLQIQRFGIDSRRYQIFWELVGLERSPLSLVSTTEELLGRKSSGSGVENREYGRRDPSHWPCGTLHPQKLQLTLPIISCCSVGMVGLLTQATELAIFSCFMSWFSILKVSNSIEFTLRHKSWLGTAQQKTTPLPEHLTYKRLNAQGH
jgi:hypothetical protein